MPIGIHRKTESFTNHTIEIENNALIYLFSDGYIDQFGGEKDRKFLGTNFRDMIFEIHNQTLQTQEQLIEEKFDAWKGSYYQIDDVLVLGAKINVKSVNISPIKNYQWADKLFLIAEDIPDNFLLLEGYLSQTNAEIIWAKNGKEAIEMYKNYKPDLVLMDIQMPIMNGYEAIEVLKQIAPELPIVVITAFNLAGEKEKSFKAGCDDYITKPINQKELFSTISKYIE